jgi:hypothetical protein
MAFKTVVANSFLEQVLDSVRHMTAKNGPFALVMLLPSESGLPNKWNLVVSAKWIDDSGLQAAIPTVSSSLREHLSKLNAKKIERISVLSTTDSLVQDLKLLDIQPGTAYQVQTFALTARGIGEAIILAAQQPRSSSARQLQTVRTRA